ncbi:MAG: hypothetical protein ACI9YH_005010 [Colwellia sp.]|jgi:hypothetical protein
MSRDKLLLDYSGHRINCITSLSIIFSYGHFNYLRRASGDEHNSDGLHFFKSKMKAIYR